MRYESASIDFLKEVHRALILGERDAKIEMARTIREEIDEGRDPRSLWRGEITLQEALEALEGLISNDQGALLVLDSW